MFWTTLLNCEDRCVQVLTRSMALSKFFTYSPYIFMNGASFCRMSPIRGLESLPPETKRVEAKDQSTPKQKYHRDKKNPKTIMEFNLTWSSSLFYCNYWILMTFSKSCNGITLWEQSSLEASLSVRGGWSRHKNKQTKGTFPADSEASRLSAPLAQTSSTQPSLNSLHPNRIAVMRSGNRVFIAHHSPVMRVFSSGSRNLSWKQ